jgi:hypothetical protein
MPRGIATARHRDDPSTFVEFATDPANRPQAQQFFDLWLQHTLVAFGRPRADEDDHAVELGLRTQGTAGMVRVYLAEIEPFLTRCNLTMPSLAELGIELPGSANAAG